MTRIDDHVGLRAHVAGDARPPVLFRVVEVVLPDREALGLMARGAHVVVGDLHLCRVGVVAVGARDAPRVHPALQERAPVVDLVLHLPVRVVQPLLEQRRVMRLAKELAGQVVLGEQASSRVAAGTHLVLDPELRRLLRDGDAPLHVHLPAAVPPFVEAHHDAGVALRLRAAGLGRLRPGHVPGARAVAGLARDVDLGERRAEAVFRPAVVLAEVGGVALRALRVPALGELRPVENVEVIDALARVEVEPALASLLGRTGVPADSERLVASVRQLDEVLLQRGEAEDVVDRVVGPGPVRTVGEDEVAPALPVETGGDPGVGELRVREVPEDRRLRRLLHGEVVVRAPPEPGLLLVAGRADLDPDVDEGRRTRGRGSPLRAGHPPDGGRHQPPDGEGEQGQDTPVGGRLHGTSGICLARSAATTAWNLFSSWK